MPDLQTAIMLHRAGRLAEAEEVYRALLAENPNHAEALQLLGLIACQENNLTGAAELIRRAIGIMPENAEFHINLAEVMRRMNRLGEAETALRRAAELAPANAFVWYNLGVVLRGLKAGEARQAFERAILLEPRLAEAHNNLALLRHQAGDYAGAIESFGRALALRPGHAETENNLGLSLWNARREHEALGSFKAAVRARPEFAAAHLNLGTALRKLGRRSEALATLRHAATLDGSVSEIHRELGRALVEGGRIEEGIEACRRATELAPGQGENWHALAVALVAKAVRDPSADSTERADAIAAYERALELQPGTKEWAFELAAVRGQTPAAPPDAYVRVLFDEYALRFENHLVKELHYRVPEELLTEVLRHRAGEHAPWRVLDLGCGTGLCGELFRSHAASVVGVDLSPNMVELSQRRGQGKIYEQVVCAPALEVLHGIAGTIDVITAGDVFIYVGGLEEILPAAAKALAPGGLLAFSLERHDGEGYLLHRRQRYAHSLNYVRAIAGQAGLAELSVKEVNLRDDAPGGWIVVLEKAQP